MKKGFIYILSNKSLKRNLLKIGKTTKKTLDRTKQLSSSSSIPENFEIEAEFEFMNINWAEKKIHSLLSQYRYNKRREFFNCDFNVAKQAIIEVQIEDKRIEINQLKHSLNDLKKELNSSGFIKSKWIKFFNELEWDFEEKNNINGELYPDFILNTKDWDVGVHGEFEVYTRKTNVHIFIDLPDKSDFFNDNQEILEIIDKADQTRGLIIISNSPLESSVEIYIGWKFNFSNERWEKCKFIEVNNKLGLLEENETIFCIVNGEFLKRNHLYPNKNKIMDLWEIEKNSKLIIQNS